MDAVINGFGMAWWPESYSHSHLAQLAPLWDTGHVVPNNGYSTPNSVVFPISKSCCIAYIIVSNFEGRISYIHSVLPDPERPTGLTGDKHKRIS